MSNTPKSELIKLNNLQNLLSSGKSEEFTELLGEVLKDSSTNNIISGMFFYACKNNLGKELFVALKQNDFDFNSPLKLGILPLQYIINMDQPEYIALLVKNYNVNINAVDTNGQTCLHLIQEGDRPIANRIQELIDLGANPNIQNNQGKFPLEKFINGSNLELIILLAKHTKLNSKLMRKIKDNIHLDNDKIKKIYIDLLNHYFKINNIENAKFIMQDSLNSSSTSNVESYHIINEIIGNCSENDAKKKLFMLSDLICEQVPINQNLLHLLIFKTIEKGINPVDQNHRKCDFIFINIALNHSISLSEPTSSGLTPLQLAINLKKPKMIDVLIEYGADPNMLNPKGDSAIHLAARSGDLVMIGRLLAKGANINLTNGDGIRPIEQVIGGSNVELIKYLAKYTIIDSENPKDKALLDKLEDNGYLNDDEKNSIIFKARSPETSPDNSAKRRLSNP